MKDLLRQGPKESEIRALKSRRERLFAECAAQLKEGERSILVVSSAGSGASLYGYRACQNMAYISGCLEPDSVAVFVGGGSHALQKRSILFKKDRDLNYELWNGPMMTLAEAQRFLGFDHVFPLESLPSELSHYLKECDVLHYEATGSSALHQLIERALELSRARRNSLEVRESRHVFSRLRLRKDDVELEKLQRASDISSMGHEIAMKNVKPGMHEYELQAWLEFSFKNGGSEGLGYQSIVAAGSNACCLHYNLNRCPIDESDLVLIDAGAQFEGYTADITRTFPASGQFTKEQALIYDIVLDVQKACIEMVKPGASHFELQNFAVRRMCERLEEEGILDLPARECVEREDYKRFYAHSLGHWLGRDVHDLGPNSKLGQPLAFEPGHVITIEPGLYFQTYDLEVPERFRGIGIRIEDDIVVTQTGHLNLTSAVKERSAIEKLMVK